MQNRKKFQRETAIILGKGSDFEGNLKFFGTTLIEGRFKGTISGEGTLSIGKEGKIDADIHVSHIIIYGEIRGNVMAEKMIELNAPGSVYGNLESPVVRIETGAIIEGKCLTRPPEPAEKEALQRKIGGERVGSDTDGQHSLTLDAP